MAAAEPMFCSQTTIIHLTSWWSPTENINHQKIVTKLYWWPQVRYPMYGSSCYFRSLGWRNIPVQLVFQIRYATLHYPSQWTGQLIWMTADPIFWKHKLLDTFNFNDFWWHIVSSSKLKMILCSGLPWPRKVQDIYNLNQAVWKYVLKNLMV